MAISRRLRFEVLRRDNHTCRYCGQSAPNVALAVDHVVPVALGGSDDPSNLVTACVDCNNGKASIAPGSEIVDDVAADALRWANAMRLAAQTMVAEREGTLRQLDAFNEAWGRAVGTGIYDKRPPDWDSTIETFLRAGLPLEVLEDAAWIAGGKRMSGSDRWRYFCGICWRKVTELQERARAIVETEEPSGGT